jgi:phosphoribosyl 1,2-cyclic phosphodiesterase
MNNASSPQTATITFLGTGGARFMIISQALHSGGIWLNLGGTQLLVDPGPGCIVRATDRKLDPEALSAIILSHRHLDHAADANIMTEAMTRGGYNKHGRFLAPADALEGDETVLFSFLRRHLDAVETLEEGKSFAFGDVTLTTPVRHQHRGDTFGMTFRTPRHTFSYIADTRYFEELSGHYKAASLSSSTCLLDPRSPSDDYPQASRPPLRAGSGTAHP